MDEAATWAAALAERAVALPARSEGWPTKHQEDSERYEPEPAQRDSQWQAKRREAKHDAMPSPLERDRAHD
jgi:hypothetical protein